MDPCNSSPPELPSTPAAALSNSPNAGPAPAPLGPVDLASRAQLHHDRLAADRPPRDYLESLAQIQVSRNAAELDMAFDLAASQLTSLPAAASVQGSRPSDARQIQALRTPAMAALLRFESSHQQSFVAAVRQLTRLQSRDEEIVIPAIFTCEEDCENYLITWQKSQAWSCPHCGHAQRYWHMARLRFDCPCGKQYSATVGTLFNGSHLPLLTWFTATMHVLYRPHVTPGQLAAHLPTSRRQSIGAALQKIKQALASDDADRLLAGVPQLAVAHLPKVLGSRALRLDAAIPDPNPK
jgi:hypothetical protein